MEKTHDDEEVEIDLRELFYALKKNSCGYIGWSSDCRSSNKAFDDTCLQRNIYNACSHKGNNTFFTG